MKNPFQVVRDFEVALCEYTGAPYAVTVTSCTMALLLAVKWHLTYRRPMFAPGSMRCTNDVEIPKRTYVGVPMSIIHAGGRPIFRDEDWKGLYQLRPLPVFDSARFMSRDMYQTGMMCLSFHWNKTLGIQQGGAILLDDHEAALWLRRARFDGRQEGVAPKDQKDWAIGWHCYMAPETAAAGLVRLASLPSFNDPLPNDDYPDLSQIEIFREE